METIVLTATFFDGSQEFLTSLQEMLNSRGAECQVNTGPGGITNIIAVKKSSVLPDTPELPEIQPATLAVPDMVPTSTEDTPEVETVPAENEQIVVEPNKMLCRLLHLNHNDYIPVEINELSDRCELHADKVTDVMGYVKFTFHGCEYNYPCSNRDGDIVISCCILFQNSDVIYNCEFVVKQEETGGCKVIVGKSLVDRVTAG